MNPPVIPTCVRQTLQQAPPTRAPLLRARGFAPGLAHGFTTRLGGTSRGPLGSLNLARRPHETHRALRANWEAALHALHPHARPADLVLLNQTHGNHVHTAHHPTGHLRTLADGDALISTTPGLVLAVRTADCVPVLLAAGDPGRWLGVAAIHAGWRGVAAHVVPHTVRALAARLDHPIHAAVGPHIGRDAFEVSDDVASTLLAAGAPDASVDRSRARPHVDLRAIVVAQLRAAGVSRIHHVRRCTATDPALFSHRRDGPSTGRQAALIRLPLPTP